VGSSGKGVVWLRPPSVRSFPTVALWVVFLGVSVDGRGMSCSSGGVDGGVGGNRGVALEFGVSPLLK
jgi:hypothetical protein